MNLKFWKTQKEICVKNIGTRTNFLKYGFAPPIFKIIVVLSYVRSKTKMECVELEAFLGDFSVDDLLDLSNADTAFVREESSSSQREEGEQEREKAKSFSDHSTRLSPLEELLSFHGDVPVSPLAHSVSTYPVLLCFALFLFCFYLIYCFVCEGWWFGGPRVVIQLRGGFFLRISSFQWFSGDSSRVSGGSETVRSG